MPRLFVAAWPDDPTRDVLERFPRPERRDVRWTTADQWHVTLRFLGEAAPDAVDARLRRAQLPAGPLEVEMGPATARLGRDILQVPVRGLDDVASAVVRATAAVGKAPDGRPFMGHLTLARTSGRGPVDLASLTGVPIAATWTVGEITLVQSTLHPQGARYEVVARYALG